MNRADCLRNDSLDRIDLLVGLLRLHEAAAAADLLHEAEELVGVLLSMALRLEGLPACQCNPELGDAAAVVTAPMREAAKLLSALAHAREVLAERGHLEEMEKEVEASR
jgi:hypothetical protein